MYAELTVNIVYRRMLQDRRAARSVGTMLPEHPVEECVQRDENSGQSGEVLTVYVPNSGGKCV